MKSVSFPKNGSEMKVAFLSSTEGNKGPSNVHRELVAHWPESDILLLAAQNPKHLKIVDSVIKGLRADVVLSGDADWAELVACRVLHAFGRPVVCFNHGYVPFENDINGLGLSRRKTDAYQRYLEIADAVVANSKHQMKFVARMQPRLEDRLTFVNNAVDPFEQREHHASSDGTIHVAASGGTRPIKGNETVAKAVRILNERGLKATLTVYGRGYAENPELSKLLDLPYIGMKGQVPREQLLRDLQNVDVFVMNSVHESFGLSALDAIEASCSLLISRNCGVADVLTLEDDDVVEDCKDAVEVADKIVGLLAHPNAERLYRALDFDALSWKRTAQKLRDVIRERCFARKNERQQGERAHD